MFASFVVLFASLRPGERALVSFGLGILLAVILVVAFIGVNTWLHRRRYKPRTPRSNRKPRDLEYVRIPPTFDERRALYSGSVASKKDSKMPRGQGSIRFD